VNLILLDAFAKAPPVEDPIRFLSKPRNKKGLELLRKGYKNIEVAKITGLHVNTITKIKRHI
jgi:DNA-binding NarL/FixJ family response regulator